jgi:hypothetical protein
MKFEDLEARPIETLRSMYDRLGLDGFDLFEANVRAYLRSIGDYQKNVHNLDDADRQKVADRWRFMFERYGYAI